MQRLIVNALKNLGYSDILMCDSGKSAMSILNSMTNPLKIDFILSDWHMPEMNGLELLKTIKKGKHKDIPFIMITSEQQKENIVHAIESGAADYIIKPINAKMLKEKINHIFGDKEKEEKKSDKKKGE
jgi:two-component system chemotaxis response regulator CheY